MALGKEYQAKVINAGNVLVGVAQVRVGLPSDRLAGTAIVGVGQAVTQSTLITDATDGVTKIVRPTRTPNVGTGTPFAATGTYTGKYDGAFIIRYNGTTYDIFSPNGYMTAGVAVADLTAGEAIKMNATVESGLTLTGTITTPASGDTWIVPVWSGTVMTGRQTNIITPYAPFKGSGNSVGGLKSAVFTPKLDGVKLLESGFPEGVDDRMITKTSASVKFEALEFTGPVMVYLRDMVSQIINENKLVAVSCEMVMRTRSNKLVTFWMPNMGMNAPPAYGPQNDYSTLPWELEAFNLTEVSADDAGFEDTDAAELATLNAWLRSSWIFQELNYVH